MPLSDPPAPAFLCRICGDQPWWRIERADAVVTWACPTDLHLVLMDLLRLGYNDHLTVMESQVVVSP